MCTADTSAMTTFKKIKMRNLELKRTSMECARFLLLAAGIPFACDAGATGASHTELLPTGRFSLPAATAAATPTMGWNPWNAFRTEVTEAKILGVADKLVSSGLAQRGYRYVNIDDGWWLKRRADGRIEVRTSMFPSAAMPDGSTSLRPFVDRLHAAGLKAGLYTDIGRNACSQIWDTKSPNLPVGTQAEREIGSHDFQAQDMRLMFGEWNFDLVKVDACGLADYAPGKPAVASGRYRAFGPYIVRGKPAQSDSARVEQLYAGLKHAIDAVRPTGDYVLSICSWGEARVADWAKQYGNSWRTSPDIHATWKSMLHNFDSAASRPLYAGPGRWNDPDMLQVGNGEFDAQHLVQARAHMSLWAIINAPLIIGTDLTKSPQAIFDIVGNPFVIAINQDVAGHQGVTVQRDGDAQVLVKSLATRGMKAVALVNRGAAPLAISVAVARLGFAAQAGVTLRDVWSGKFRKLSGTTLTAQLEPFETVLLMAQGTPALEDGVYLDQMPGRINVAAGGSLPAGRDWVPAQASAAPSGAPLAAGGKRYDNGLGVLVNSRLEVRLDGEFKRFHARPAILDESGATALPVHYRVYGDGKLRGEARTAATGTLDVDVTGVRTLELVAESPGAAFAVAWLDAKVTR